MTAEIIWMWVAITLFALGTAIYIAGVVFNNEKRTWLAYRVSLLGIVPLIVALAIRWIRVGHGPYLGFYEVTAALTFFSLVTFALLVWRYPSLVSIGVAVMPVVLLLMGGALLSPKSGLPITPALASYWLAIHVIFSDLAFGAFVGSFALAVVLVVRERSTTGVWARRFERLPSQEVVDDLSFRLISAGFLFWCVMTASGAIWANEAWGRYWAWDPIEVWTLVVLLVYAAYLHLRLTMGWRDEKAAWFAIVALPICAFSLLGIPIVFNSIHAGYLTG